MSDKSGQLVERVADTPKSISLTEDEIWYLLEEVHIPHLPDCTFWTVSGECSGCLSGTIRDKMRNALPAESSQSEVSPNVSE